MKKTLITVACIIPGALSAQSPVLISPTVQIYGTLLPFVDNVSVKGTTAPGLSPANGGATQVPASAYTGLDLPTRNRMTSGTSNLGFRGSMEVADNVKVFWQIESAVSPDGDAPNAWTSRNSCLGLEGSWGHVFYGQWDTPYKWPILLVGALRGLSPFDDAIIGNPGFNAPGTTTQTGRINGKADAAFNRRQGNSIQYWSPEFSGFSFRLAYALNEGKTVPSATAPSISPDIISALVTYKTGDFRIDAAYERHNDYFGLSQLGGAAGGTLTNPSSKDEGYELIASYKFPTNTKLSVIVEQLDYTNSDSVSGDVNEYKRSAWYALVQQFWGGKHQLFASYGSGSAGSCTRVGGAPGTTNGLGASQYSLGYVYSFNKATDLFASYYGMTNDRSAQYASFPPLGTIAPGGDQKGLGVGLLFTF